MASLFEAYLAGEAEAFFGAHYADASHRRRAVDRARARPAHPAVIDALRAQNAGRGSAVDASLDALAAGAAAVVTGQQMGLFLGPLFTLYKAATAVSAARALSAETGHPVVPLFWLQTEDHDLPEIARTYLRGPGGEPIVVEVPVDRDDRRSVAHQRLPAEIEGALGRMSEALRGLPAGPEHVDRLARHYRPGATWSAAFTGAIGELTAEDGLVLLEPRDPRIAARALPLHRRAIADAEALSEALLQRSKALEAAGFEAAVHVRPGSPLSFFHPGGAEGPRFRLAPADGGYAEIGGAETHARARLLEASDALRFSASALLRPVIQDALLPTAAYVGGPGEVAYFAQLQPLYAGMGVEMPLVLPRARFTIVEDKARALLDRLGVEVRDARLGEDALLARATPRDAPALPDLAAGLDPLRAELESLGLASAYQRTRASIELAMGKLAEKVEHARLHRDEARVAEVRRLKSLLHPLDQPQERVLGPSYFMARHGERRMIQAVLDAIVPFDAQARELSL